MATLSRAAVGRWLVAVPLVVAAVLGGLWVTGGLLTNDFALAMALSAAWIALAGLACVLIAWRRPELRVPVLGAFWSPPWWPVPGSTPQFVDDVVNERVVTAAPSARPDAGGAATCWSPAGHSARGPRGAAPRRVIRTAAGRHVLTLTGFEVDNGPDLRVYLVEGPARTEAEVRQFEDLGALKGNKGDQQYELRGARVRARSHRGDLVPGVLRQLRPSPWREVRPGLPPAAWPARTSSARGRRRRAGDRPYAGAAWPANARGYPLP